MAGTIDLDSVGTAAATEGTTSTEAPKIDTPVEDSGQDSQATQETQGPEIAVGKPEETTSETTSETPTEATEQTTEMLHVGDKDYSKEEIESTLTKVGKFQGDRDRAESALENVISQLYQQGMTVDKNMRVVPLQQTPMVNKQEIIEQAAAGDAESMGKLVDQIKTEVRQETAYMQQKATEEERARTYTRKNYPQFYNEAGEFNQSSPLSQSATKVIGAYPWMGETKFLPLVAELAQARMYKNKFPQIEQEIKNSTQQKFNKSAAASVGTPSKGVVEPQQTAGLTDAQKIAAKKMGLSEDRIAKIAQRAAKKGEYYL